MAFGEIASSQATIAEAISLAKEPNDIHGLAVSLFFAGVLAHCERNPAEVERLASNMVELSTRQNFALWRAEGVALRGWARSAFGETAEGIAWISLLISCSVTPTYAGRISHDLSVYRTVINRELAA